MFFRFGRFDFPLSVLYFKVFFHFGREICLMIESLDDFIHARTLHMHNYNFIYTLKSKVILSSNLDKRINVQLSLVITL